VFALVNPDGCLHVSSAVLFSENFIETAVSANRIMLGKTLIVVSGALREARNVIRFRQFSQC